MAHDTVPFPYPPGGGYEKHGGLEVHPDYHHMRRQCPVAHVTTPEGDPVVLVTRHKDVRKVLAQPEVFSREHGSAADGLRDQPFLTDVEGPRHVAQRELIEPFFTKTVAERIRPRVHAMVEGLLEGMRAAGQPADLIQHLALPLPVTVICHILHVPQADSAQLGAWAGDILALGPGADDGQIAAARQAERELADYMYGLLEEFRLVPGDDLLSVLATTDHPLISEHDRVLLGTAVLLAGYETTAHNIGNQVYTLIARFPELWR